MNSKVTLPALAVLLAVGMAAARATDSGTPVLSAEEITKIKEDWNQKTHGRPVVINWTYMTVRCNQDQRASGEYMYMKFAYMVLVAKMYKIPTTWMFEHQCLLDERFCNLMRRELKDDPTQEPAMNMQFGQELVEKAGLKWDRPYAWNPDMNVAYHSGYDPKTREKLVDLYMEDFKAVFGRYPKTAGAWMVDTYTIRYMHDKYGVIASAQCPDQWRTDCYTLWGAPVNTPYVMARNNAYMPAQTPEKSMGVAVWRMTGGSCPIYHYEGGIATYPFCSMQMPALFASGGDYGRWWIEMVAQTPLSIGAITPGQEVDWIGTGIEDLAKLIEEYRDLGLVRTETLSQTAEWFLNENPVTPPGGYNALVDSGPYYRPSGWDKKYVAEYLNNNVREQPEENQRIIDNFDATLPWGLPRKATWYSSRFYRCGLVWEGDEFRLRDLYLYDEDFPDSYSAQAARSRDNVYMALPVMDGMQWSSIAAGKLAGIRLVAIQPDGKREPLKVGEPKLDTMDNKSMIVTFPLLAGGEASIVFDENAATFSIRGEGAPRDWGLELSWYRQAQAFWNKVDPKNTEPNLDFFKIARVEPRALTYAFSPPTTLQEPELDLPRRNWTYVVGAVAGTFSQPEPRVVLMRPEAGQVKLNLVVKAKEIQITVPPPPPVVTETDLSLTGGSFATLSTNDLILGNAGVSSLGIQEPTGGWTTANLTEGVLNAPGSVGNQLGVYGGISGGTITYNLGDGVNGAGYDITGVRSLTVWRDSGRINPNYTVSYSLDGVHFFPMATVNYSATAGASGTDVALGITGLANLRSLQFTFPNTQQNGWVSYTELAVFGTSSPVTNTRPTQTLLSSSANPSLSGGSVTFTAVVWAGGVMADSATSNLVFQVDGTDVFTNAVVSGAATYTNSTLTVGTHTITAVYRGDASYAASTNLVTQTIYLPPVVTETDLSLTNGSFASLAGNDLILGNAGNSAALNYFEAKGGWTPANLADGDLKAPGAVGNQVGVYSIITGGAVTYNLGGGANGLGYDLTGVRTTTSWQDSGRINPNYTVSYSSDGVSFYPLATVNYSASAGADGTDVALGVTGLSKVKSIRFNFGSQQNDGVTYTELAVFGQSTAVVCPSLSAQMLPPGLTNLVLNLSDLRAGQSYTLQSSPSLSPAAWSNAVTFAATQATAAYTNATGTNAMQFFRLVY